MAIQPDISKAVKILQEGGLVAFPTETVYGLGADASNETAINKVFEAKGRPYDHPLIVHIADIGKLDEWVQDVSVDARKLANAFWPGSLTLVLNRQPHVADLVTAGQPTVAVRVPCHPVAQALLKAFGGGLVAPSANQFMHISPTTAAAVEEEIGGRVSMILDGGECEVGLESTIIDMSHDRPTILRPGMITAAQISDILDGKEVDVIQSSSEKVRAPGMHHKHYAPDTRTTLIERMAIPEMIDDLPASQLPVAFMTHSNVHIPQREGVQQIQMPADAKGYAHDLYQQLRQLDHAGLQRIFIETVPNDPAWDGIRDRLSKAAEK